VPEPLISLIDARFKVEAITASDERGLSAYASDIKHDRLVWLDIYDDPKLADRSS